MQAIVQISPPYNGYLPDYADPLNEQLKILLTLTDFAVPSYEVKLRLKITGSGFTIQTKPFALFTPIDLTPGTPVQISGSDLAPYLSTTNLDFSGISIADYETRKVLPEGLYTICVEALDYLSATGTVLSNQACASAWFTLNDPPMLNTPFCGTQLDVVSPQNVMFSWSPMHMSTPGDAFNTQYEFQLFEVRPAGANANVVVTTTLPIFTTINTLTFYNYGIADPPLQVGMQYVWRVRAIDVEGHDYFKNNGYSQPCTFTWGNIAEETVGNISLNLTANGTASRQGLANWNASAGFTHYTLEVRKTGNPSYAWFPYSSTSGTLKVNGLEPQTQYECRVKGHAGEFTSEYSNTATFTTLPLTNYACNSVALPPVESGVAGLTNLPVGSIFTAGQFEVTVTQVTYFNGLGKFSGFGKVYIPFALFNLGVYFENIFIDQNMAMRTGRVIALSEGVEQWAAGATDNTYNTNTPDYYYNGDADSVVLSGGNIIIYEDGVAITIPYPGGNFTVEDENGDQWTVYSDGTVQYTPALPHVELSSAEKNIFRKAMALIREDYPLAELSQKKNNYQTSQTTLENKVTNTVGVNYLQTPSATTTTANRGFMIEEEVTDELPPSQVTEVQQFQTSKHQYLVHKTLRSIAKLNMTDAETDFVSNTVKINSLPSYLYIRQNITTITADELASTLKNAIVEMVEHSVPK